MKTQTFAKEKNINQQRVKPAICFLNIHFLLSTSFCSRQNNIPVNS